MQQMVSLLQILLLAHRVSGTIMPIIRSSRVVYSGCCLRYLVLCFSRCRSGAELRVMCPVCGMLLKQYPANRTHNPQLHTTNNLKTTVPNTTGSNHLYNTLELLMMGIVMPETW